MQVTKVVGVLAAAMLVVGCEVDPAEAEAIEQSWLDDEASARFGGGGFGGTGDQCTTFDGVITGCEDDEICLPIACTNSIPPFCFGFCQAGFGGFP